MSWIYGALGLSEEDNQRLFVQTAGQELVFLAAQTYLAQWSAGLNAAESVFVEMETRIFKERYLLPGYGYMPKLGTAGPSPAVKARGKYDTAYPIEMFGDSLGYNRVSFAHLTLGMFQNDIDTITNRAVQTRRFNLLYALFNNTQRTFGDITHGDLEIEPGANGDAVLYPPIAGAEAEATEDHYLESGYVAGDIDDTNNPYITIAADLSHHWGEVGEQDILVWINEDQKRVTEDLTDFDSIRDPEVQPGTQTAIARPIDTGPGIPVGKSNNCNIKIWSFVPTGYMLALATTQRGPLKRRVWPSDVNLPTGLALVQTDERYPVTTSSYEMAHGFGAGNRLNLVVMELATGGTYTIPTIYQ